MIKSFKVKYLFINFMVFMIIGGFIFGFCSNKIESIGKGITIEGRIKYG